MSINCQYIISDWDKFIKILIPAEFDDWMCAISLLNIKIIDINYD